MSEPDGWEQIAQREGATGLIKIVQEGLRKVTEDEIRRDERTRCWRAINKCIKSGELPGSGWDESAQRNGLILATNEIAAMGINFGTEGDSPTSEE